jgi:urease alpha subunit
VAEKQHERGAAEVLVQPTHPSRIPHLHGEELRRDQLSDAHGSTIHRLAIRGHRVSGADGSHARDASNALRDPIKAPVAGRPTTPETVPARAELLARIREPTD